MPQEQEIPAPVTTTILLLLATARDKSERDLLVEGSDNEASRFREIVIVESVEGVEGAGLIWNRSDVMVQLSRV